jgi:hypothetical protein
MLEDITFAAQIAFFISICLALIVFLCSLVNLIFDYKTRIMEARRGIFRDTKMEEVEIMQGSSFPGYMISCSIAGFIITLLCGTIALTALFWSLFWVFLWSKKEMLITVIIPIIVKSVIEGWF